MYISWTIFLALLIAAVVFFLSRQVVPDARGKAGGEKHVATRKQRRKRGSGKGAKGQTTDDTDGDAKESAGKGQASTQASTQAPAQASARTPAQLVAGPPAVLAKDVQSQQKKKQTRDTGSLSAATSAWNPVLPMVVPTAPESDFPFLTPSAPAASAASTATNARRAVKYEEGNDMLPEKPDAEYARVMKIVSSQSASGNDVQGGKVRKVRDADGWVQLATVPRSAPASHNAGTGGQDGDGDGLTKKQRENMRKKERQRMEKEAEDAAQEARLKLHRYQQMRNMYG